MNEPTSEDWGRDGRIAAFLQRAGIVPEQMRAVQRGRNSRVLEIEGSSRAALKCYYADPGEGHDRLAAEYAFVQFCWKHGIRSAPRPLAVDPPGRMALYEWIEGRRLNDAELEDCHIAAALDFVMALNQLRTSEDTANLGAAAEACFSTAEHVNCVGRRVERLQQLTGNADVYRAAARFVERSLKPKFDKVTESLASGSSFMQVLPQHARCLSPSDFGFHNALSTADGRVRFIDFEYAGWDDPAKLVWRFLLSNRSSDTDPLLGILHTSHRKLESGRAQVRREVCRAVAALPAEVGLHRAERVLTGSGGSPDL